MNELVERLSNGMHPVEVTIRPTKSVHSLKECLDRGYVHVKFTGTRGGTELGVPVDPSRSDLTTADFAAETGTVRIVGALTLDYVNVRCIANIDLPSLTGVGQLEVVAD